MGIWVSGYLGISRKYSIREQKSVEYRGRSNSLVSLVPRAGLGLRRRIQGEQSESESESEIEERVAFLRAV